jgi:DNA-binding NtrC family response regulator
MKGIRVLLVDDEVELVTTLRERLELRGMQAESATSGEEALRRVETTPFDVVVVDLKLPGLDGTKIVDRIRKRRPGTKVVLITGHGSGHGELEDLGECDYPILLKPFPIQRLVEQIQKWTSGPEAER